MFDVRLLHTMLSEWSRLEVSRIRAQIHRDAIYHGTPFMREFIRTQFEDGGWRTELCGAIMRRTTGCTSNSDAALPSRYSSL